MASCTNKTRRDKANLKVQNAFLGAGITVKVWEYFLFFPPPLFLFDYMLGHSWTRNLATKNKMADLGGVCLQFGDLFLVTNIICPTAVQLP